MNIIIHALNNEQIAEVEAKGVVINNAQDALDIIAEASYLGVKGIIIHEYNLMEEFFNLRTGIAGDLLQKFSQYHMKIAIIGDFEKFDSKSLQAFIHESNRGNQVFFVGDIENALSRISDAPDTRFHMLRR
jgi:hypothetical protein